MKILVIDNKLCPWTDELDLMMRERGVHVEHLSPTLLSPITALKAAVIIDRAFADLVIASTLGNAAAAMSACSVAKHKAKPVAMVPPGAKAPRGVPTALEQSIRAWVFASKDSKDRYPGNLKGAAVIGHISHLPFAAPSADAKPTLLWAGPIDGNSLRLRQTIKLVDNSDEWQSLIVYGTGKAREVMPAVRDGRAMANPHKLEWLPQSTTLAQAADRATAIVQAGIEPTGLELALAENGRQLLLPSESGFVPAPPYPTTTQRADALASLFKSLC